MHPCLFLSTSICPESRMLEEAGCCRAAPVGLASDPAVLSAWLGAGTVQEPKEPFCSVDLCSTSRLCHLACPCPQYVGHHLSTVTAEASEIKPGPCGSLHLYGVCDQSPRSSRLPCPWNWGPGLGKWASACSTLPGQLEIRPSNTLQACIFPPAKNPSDRHGQPPVMESAEWGSYGTSSSAAPRAATTAATQNTRTEAVVRGPLWPWSRFQCSAVHWLLAELL